MSIFKIDNMGGIMPRLPADRLPDGGASLAENCDFGYGELRNIKDGNLVATLTNVAKAIYTDDGTSFYSWTVDVDSVRSPLINDTFNRMYFTGDGGMKVASRLGTSPTGGPPASPYLVGVPRPTVKPVVTAIAGITAATTETRAYVYVFVNIYGEMGPPSEATLVTTDMTAQPQVTVKKDAMAGRVPLKEVWVYRTPTGSTSATYYYTGKIDVLALADGATTVFTDTTPAASLNEALTSTNFYPPDPALVGLMSLPNGILCAWKGRELHFSEPYRPWAWPPGYVKALESNIVGGIVHGSGAVITTVRSPYLLSGVAPDAMTVSKLNVDQAGVSKWSIAVVDGAVMYASHDGLVMIVGATASLRPSERFFTRDVWRQRYAAGLSAMRFSVWDGRLIAFAADGSITPFMVKYDEADGSMTDMPGFYASCAFVSQLSDQCYYVTNNGLYQFAGGANKTAVWESREMVLPQPTNYGAAQAKVESGTWTIKFYADRVLRHTEVVNEGTTTFKLPSGFRAERWKVRLEGVGRFNRLVGGTSAMELARV